MKKTNSQKRKIYHNGKICTMDEKKPWVEAISIHGNKIISAGTMAEVKANSTYETENVDLDGKFMMPGFVDSHNHGALTMYGYLNSLNLYGAEKRTDYYDRLKKHLKDHPESKIIEGEGWDNPIFGETLPHKDMLDMITSEIPVLLRSGDGHSMWVNSKAMEAAGVSTAGNGLYREEEQNIFDIIRPELTLKNAKEGISEYQKMAAKMGITESFEAMIKLESPQHKAFLEMDKNNELLIKTSAAIRSYPEILFPKPEILEQYTGEEKGDRFKINHMKIFVDGVVEGHTAYLKKPYSDNPDSYGELIWDTDKLKQFCVRSDKAGLDIHYHVIGDGAVNVMLEVMEYVRKQNGTKERRPVAAHMQLLDPNDIIRLQSENFTISANPYWFCKEQEYFEGVEIPYLGRQRAENEYPMKTFFDMKIPVSVGSDFPVTIPPNPLMAIQMGMTRSFPGGDPIATCLNPSEKVDLMKMLKAVTINGAYTTKNEKITGSLSSGKLADMIILSDNIFGVDPYKISEIEVLETISEGETIYRR